MTKHYQILAGNPLFVRLNSYQKLPRFSQKNAILKAKRPPNISMSGPKSAIFKAKRTPQMTRFWP